MSRDHDPNVLFPASLLVITVLCIITIAVSVLLKDRKTPKEGGVEAYLTTDDIAKSQDEPRQLWNGNPDTGYFYSPKGDLIFASGARERFRIKPGSVNTTMFVGCSEIDEGTTLELSGDPDRFICIKKYDEYLWKRIRDLETYSFEAEGSTLMRNGSMQIRAYHGASGDPAFSWVPFP